jgi:hypothetical protein
MITTGQQLPVVVAEAERFVSLIAGMEAMHMIRKGQLDGHEGEALSAAHRFYSPTFRRIHHRTFTGSRPLVATEPE